MATSGLMDDNYAVSDQLGFTATAELLTKAVLKPPPLPFTLGIFGQWGSGKTSMMRMIERGLKQEKRKTVWFNAWKYDAKEVIWNALIQSIFLEMRNDPDLPDGVGREDFRDRVGVVARDLAVYAAKVATRFIPGGIVRDEDVDHVVATLASSATDEQFAFVNSFEFRFDKLVAEYVGEVGPLVIFIDDLDRCLPENAVNVMEALKLYLDRANCVFVIGAESGVIEQGIAQRYGANSRLPAEEYLDKIIQLPFVLPSADEATVAALLANLDDRPIYRDPQMLKLVQVGTGGNPRRVKRFMNVFWILSQISEPPDLNAEQKLAKVLMIQMRFPRLFRELAANRGLAQSLSDTVLGPHQTLTERRNSGSPLEKELLTNEHLVAFFGETRDITIRADEINEWVVLTGRHASSFAPTIQPT